MADFGAASLANLEGVKPITAARAVAMAAFVTAGGGDISIPDDGGLRTLARQAQLLQYEQDSVAAGGKPYAVHKPNPDAPHTTGDAFDTRVNVPMSGLSVDGTYRAMADYAPSIGLTAGYWFAGGPPADMSDPFHFQNTNRNQINVPDSGDLSDTTAPAGATSVAVVVVVVLVGLLFLSFGSKS